MQGINTYKTLLCNNVVPFSFPVVFYPRHDWIGVFAIKFWTELFEKTQPFGIPCFHGLSQTNSFSEDLFQKSYTIVTHFVDSYLGKIRSKTGKQWLIWRGTTHRRWQGVTNCKMAFKLRRQEPAAVPPKMGFRDWLNFLFSRPWWAVIGQEVISARFARSGCLTLSIPFETKCLLQFDLSFE